VLPSYRYAIYLIDRTFLDLEEKLAAKAQVDLEPPLVFSRKIAKA
jgi:hypothetical protein